jgi:PleD family two-component response regulator
LLPEAAVEAGANDFIAKPVEETEFRIRAASLPKLKDAQDLLKSQQTHLEAIVSPRSKRSGRGESPRAWTAGAP